MVSLIAGLLSKRTSKRECQTCSSDGAGYRLGTPRVAIVRGPPTVSIGDVIARSLRILLSFRWTGSDPAERTNNEFQYRLFGRPLTQVSFRAAGNAEALCTSLFHGQFLRGPYAMWHKLLVHEIRDVSVGPPARPPASLRKGERISFRFGDRHYIEWKYNVCV